MSEYSSLEVVREAYDAVAEHGPQTLIDRYDELFSDDFEWQPVLLTSVDGRVYKGRDGWEEYWKQFLETFSDIEFKAATFEAIDDHRVLVVGEVRGTGSGSGVPIDRTVAYVFQVADGLVVAGRSFFTEAEAREFLGVAA